LDDARRKPKRLSLGGHLVTIDDQTEQEFVWNTFGNFGAAARGGLWIGLSDAHN